MLDRRRLLTGVLPTLAIGGTTLGFPALLLPEPPPEEALPDGAASAGMITQKAQDAIDQGLSFLATNKLRDGSFGTSVHTGNTAITSLAALAFMAGGSMPNQGPHGRLVTDAIRFVLSQENVERQHPGFLHNPTSTRHGPMYGHGFATLFLAEVSGQIHDKQLRDDVNRVLHLAVELILKSQNNEGGWRYTPTSREADLSVTICQIMALRAARNAGVAVPKAQVDKCVEYVKRCQDRRDGWFRYMLQGPGGGGGVQAFARTAAGVAALHSAGIYKGPEIDAGIRFLRGQKPNGAAGGGLMARPDMHYFYGHYYAAQVMWTTGGEAWAQWYPAIREELLTMQQRNGSWLDQICPHYATAMALLVLQVPNNYLTIFQK